MNNPVDNHLIWISGQSWDRYAGTHRNMATAMAGYARILWVDPPVSPVTASSRRHDAARTVRPALADVTDRITRLTPVALPGLSRPGIRATTPVLVRAQVRWAARRLGLRPMAVVMAYLGDLLGGWGPGVTNVMYGTDDYVAGAKLMGLPAEHLRRREQRALASADIVATVTPELAARWSRFGARPVVIPNGCWPRDADGLLVPEGSAGLSRPVVGLIGQLSERIDFDVLEVIAGAGCSLLLAGPVDSRWEPGRFARLTSMPTVRYVGPVPSATIGSYLASIDVGITPYRNTAFNRASFPLKNLDYLSAGVPAVTAALPAAEWLRADLVETVPSGVADRILVLADNSQQYLSAIQRLGPRDAKTSRRCAAFAERHSWARRASQLAAELGLVPTAVNAAESR